MYLKWIVCDVKKDKKGAFSSAQEKWITTKAAEGFIMQLGGWNVDKSFEACILSVWEQKKYLEKFMTDQHDQIFDNNKQLETYNSIQVQYFHVLSEVEKNGLNKLLKDSTKISVFDYLKRPESGELKLKQTKYNILGINEFNSSKILDVYFSDKPFIKIKTIQDSDKFNKAEIKQILLKENWRVMG